MKDRVILNSTGRKREKIYLFHNHVITCLMLNNIIKLYLNYILRVALKVSKAVMNATCYLRYYSILLGGDLTASSGGNLAEPWSLPAVSSTPLAARRASDARPAAAVSCVFASNAHLWSFHEFDTGNNESDGSLFEGLKFGADDLEFVLVILLLGD